MYQKYSNTLFVAHVKSVFHSPSWLDKRFCKLNNLFLSQLGSGLLLKRLMTSFTVHCRGDEYEWDKP